MNPLATAVYVPPRPNPGPEPLPAPQSPVVAITLSIAGLALLAVTLAALLLSLRRRARRRRIRAERSARYGLPRVLPESPRERWIIFSRAIRRVLAERFGASWRAKTNEEMSDAPELAEALGTRRAEELIDLLRQADRAKFADSPVPEPPAPLPYLSELAAALVPEAGARSRTRGK
ncbi:MAG: hypothetical protein JO355_01535 [Planctomycetaceae bacterium]|nr:hypothetical protein [Planctomycetaceae bacterium]